MSPSATSRKSPANKRGARFSPASTRANRKERVLIEFPSALLQRADEAARALDTNRSDLIRNAVERLLREMEAKEFDRELANAYAANADMNRALVREFSEVDQEGF